MFKRSAILCLTLAALTLPQVTPAQAADCRDLLGELGGTLRSPTPETAESLLAPIYDACPKDVYDKSRAAFAAAVLRKVDAMGPKPANPAEERRLLQLAAEKGQLWDAFWRLADDQLEAREFKAAAVSYQKAIDLLEPLATSNDQLKERGRMLVKRANEARLLAANQGTGTLVVATTNHRGQPGGAYSDAFNTRGIQAVKIPPITFKFDSAEFTQVGQDAIQELIGVIKSAQPRTITVVGHTDQKGTDAYNLDLSKRRAEAVARYVQSRIGDAQYAIVAKGRREPLQLSDGSNYRQDEIDQLNRRVEMSWE